jgi:hypothetical protein
MISIVLMNKGKTTEKMGFFGNYIEKIEVVLLRKLII